jgi:hypothetical protein
MDLLEPQPGQHQKEITWRGNDFVTTIGAEAKRCQGLLKLLLTALGAKPRIEGNELRTALAPA